MRQRPRQGSTDLCVCNIQDPNPLAVVTKECEPFLPIRTDKMIPRYAYYKPFIFQLHNKREWQNRFNTDNERGLVWYTDASKTSEGTGAGVYKWGSVKGHSFSLGLHTMILRVEIYAIKACILENIEKGYRGRNINILSESQAAIKVLNSFQVNFNLV